MLHMGYTLTRALLYFRGNPARNAMPERVNLMPIQISLGTQVPQRSASPGVWRTKAQTRWSWTLLRGWNVFGRRHSTRR